LDEQLRPAEGEPPRAPPDGERARPPEGLGRRRELAARSEHDAAGALEALLVARERGRRGDGATAREALRAAAELLPRRIELAHRGERLGGERGRAGRL